MKLAFTFWALLICATLLGSTGAAAEGPVLLDVDFTDYRTGSIESWLRSKGLRLENDAKNRNRISLVADGRGLVMEALQPARGFIVGNVAPAKTFSSVEIEWGVAQFPQGASYERRVNNEAIMLHLFFGTQKRPSGSMFVPDLPYFIGLFLCNGDRVGFPYAGRYHTQSGRYVCLGTPANRDVLVSRFDLRQGVHAIFGGGTADSVSAYSISLDTTSSAGKGRSSAIIRRIRFRE